ncbi:MAG: hypothetical protein ACE5R4_13425 [Armatimonadota bacterium]
MRTRPGVYALAAAVATACLLCFSVGSAGAAETGKSVADDPQVKRFSGKVVWVYRDHRGLVVGFDGKLIKLRVPRRAENKHLMIRQLEHLRVHTDIRGKYVGKGGKKLLVELNEGKIPLMRPRLGPWHR